MKDWDELQQILGQSSLDELAGEVERLGAEARALSKEVGEEDMADLTAPLTDTEFSHAEREASETRTAFNRAQSQLEVFARDLVDVAEAKEALDAAEDEHARVRALGHTLDLTIRFLEQAEELVHRNVPPVFAETVREWLPRVTGGRYTDCRVDPRETRCRGRNGERSLATSRAPLARYSRAGLPVVTLGTGPPSRQRRLSAYT